MRDLVNWQDHVVEFPGRFQLQELGDGLYTLVPAPGEVKQQGTPQNATNFNTMDYAALESLLVGSENTRMLIRTMQDVESCKGVSIEVTLTNTLKYPHNNSQKTVQIPVMRNHTGYYVVVEPVSVTDGAIGEFEIKDKLLNGFKVNYTGSAKTVKAICHVIGGI